MIKNYKACREKAEELGKIIVLKNNQPDAVLFSIAEYERISEIIEHLDNIEGSALTKILESFPPKGKKSIFTVEHSESKEE